MKRLSNSDLRMLYLRRTLLQQMLKTVELQVSGMNVGDSWKRELARMQFVHQEIKEIVQDPQFDSIIPRPETAHPDSHIYSPTGTMVNVATTGRELIAYVDTVLSLHLTPKSEELKRCPKRAPKIFVGHGRNELVRHRVKDFVQNRCGFEPIILQELASSGMTLIEKLEQYGRQVDYAILIFTGDDLTKEGVPRPRQNVVQELGWFQGVLGRNRTAILLQKGVELPSNIEGVLYLEFEDDQVELIFEALRAEFEKAELLNRTS